MNEFEPIEWAMQQTGMTVADVVAIILTAKAPKVSAKRGGASQMERCVEFVNSEFDARAADVVARGICDTTARASALLSEACKAGAIDRLSYGVYGPKGTAHRQ
ncbi:hypothetical protein [Mycolicibacterium farcinogenes]|uniref:Uncharacterized protein n=1 Tax=Mycolicibacterium farcinogenes TaxID=1802 RepID=A0ACD1F9T3_MYCFR|nr:hypothetical protein [Mycolicibacterium farcinogenes]QZH63808.1 hypothetical protein K6L26_17150 [Mycolicibacterium farcinogenes]